MKLAARTSETSGPNARHRGRAPAPERPALEHAVTPRGTSSRVRRIPILRASTPRARATPPLSPTS